MPVVGGGLDFEVTEKKRSHRGGINLGAGAE
jgi:hypothetical protein